MYNKEFTCELISLIINNIEVIQVRSSEIKSAEDFTSSQYGMVLLDSICMKLVAIGESIKNLDKVTNKSLLDNYSQINWKQAMGMRDIIVHHYFDVDADEIFKTIKEDLPLLLTVLNIVKSDLKRKKNQL